MLKYYILMTVLPPRTRCGRLVIWAGHNWRVQRSITIQLRVHVHLSSLVVARRQVYTSFPVRRTYCRFLGTCLFSAMTPAYMGNLCGFIENQMNQMFLVQPRGMWGILGYSFSEIIACSEPFQVMC